MREGETVDQDTIAAWRALPVTVSEPRPGVVAVAARALDGDTCALIWDTAGRTARVRWVGGGAERLIVDRFEVADVSVVEHDGVVQFRVTSQAGGTNGRLVVKIRDRVSVHDAVRAVRRPRRH